MEYSAGQPDYLDGSLGIAIIGMAARFPGALDVATFWENLRTGQETIHFFTDEELRAAGVEQSELEDPSYVKAASILTDIDHFDAAFFDCSPIEATYLDPQHRLLLECAWQALEDAGYTGERGSDAVGVYAGIKMNTYVGEFFAHPELFGPADRMQIMLGNGDFSLSTRISYKLNLKGPSYMLQTACSTSLAAVHLACQALLLDECRMALAGAVAVDVPHQVGYYYQYGGPASPDGHCRPFDAGAQGTVFGSGVGLVVLKRLSDALADGDHIYAVIRGTAVNNDGAVKASFTAPSVEGQTKVIMEALACAGVEADSISYLEGHGTATPLGDPIEIMALNKAFRASTQRTGFCRLGSVKGNFGHLDAAAGIAGLIKTVLALQHKQIPPSLHFERANPEIDFANSSFVVNTELTAWEGVPLPRRAGVSSFGFGGTNTHVIVEEAPAVKSLGPARPWQVLVLSAKTDTALETTTTNLAAHLQQNPELNLADVAYTLQIGRPAFKYRRVLVCRDLADAVNLLENRHDSRVVTTLQETGDRPVVFMFPGQGAQYVNMGLELYQVEPVFRTWVDRCADKLIPHLGLDLRTVLYPASQAVEAAAQKLEQTAVTQPALFVIEYALAQLWQAWGISPVAMIGHSIGEYVAACLAGVFSLEDGLALVATRGRLMQQLPAGAMLTIALPEAEVQSRLNGHLSLAAINSPDRCVVSGPSVAIEELAQQLHEQGIVCRRLHTSHAFHSAMMDPILEPFAAQIKQITLHPPQIPYVSNLSGSWVNAEEATNPVYWTNHLRQPVRFGEGLKTLVGDRDRVLLEVGPGQTLSTLVRQNLPKESPPIILASLHDPKDTQSDVAFLLNTLGRLWLEGVKPDWPGFYTNERRQRLSLPTYPFERQRYWFDPPQSNKSQRMAVTQPDQLATLKKPEIADWFYAPLWKQSVLPIHQPEETSTRCWLFLLDECGLGSRLVERLEHEDPAAQVVMVQRGPEFARLDERTFALNPGRRDDYEALVNELAASDRRPTALVHLWSVTADETATSIGERFDQAQERGFYSLLFLLQALGKQDFAEELSLTVISTHLQAVTGEEKVCPEKATVLGPVQVIPLEYPNVSCRSIDIVLPPTSVDVDQAGVEQLLVELLTRSSDPIIAYRGSQRWVRTFEPVRLEQSPTPAAHLRTEGVYLITGGLGGIGLTLAQYLAETVHAKLVLVSRSAFPEASEWEAWLATHDDQDQISHKIRTLQSLDRAGAEVMVAQGDVADHSRMQAVLTQARQRFGTLHGVIHAAGVPGGGIIQLKTPELVASVLAPKVQGALVFDDLLKDTPLDFMVLFSSLSAVVGEFGQVDYCAANAFLDAFARQKAQAPTRVVLSINWDMWREVGMSVQTEAPAIVKDWRAEQLRSAMLPSEGVEVFNRALSAKNLAQLMVCTIDIRAKVAQFRALTRSRILGAIEQLPISKSLHPRPTLRTPYVAPRNETERLVAGIWQTVLGIERVGIHDNFFELGGDSLIGLKLIAQFKNEFGVELPAVDLYKGPTVSKLTEIINRLTGQAADDEAARKTGQQRGAQRREQRLKRKQQTGTAGGQA